MADKILPNVTADQKVIEQKQFSQKDLDMLKSALTEISKSEISPCYFQYLMSKNVTLELEKRGFCVEINSPTPGSTPKCDCYGLDDGFCSICGLWTKIHWK